jgi:hypothetical protein
MEATMSRKTSAYVRKRLAQGRTYASHADAKRYLIATSLRPLLDSRDYQDPVHQREASQTLVQVRLELQRLSDRLISADDLGPYELLTHIIEIAQIRVCEIACDQGHSAIAHASALIDSLNSGARALDRARLRWLAQHTWNLDGPAIHELRDAVDVFETVLTASSPRQMRQAQDERLRRARIRQAQEPRASGQEQRP